MIRDDEAISLMTDTSATVQSHDGEETDRRNGADPSNQPSSSSPIRRGQNSQNQALHQHGRSGRQHQQRRQQHLQDEEHQLPMNHVHYTHGYSNNSNNGSFMLRLTCLSVLTLVVLGSMGLLTYVQDVNAPTFQFIESEGSPSSDDGVNNKHFETTDRNGNGSSKAGKASQNYGQFSKVDSNIATSNRQDLDTLMKEIGREEGVYTRQRTQHTVRYNPKLSQYNPFDFEDDEALSATNPFFPLLSNGRAGDQDQDDFDSSSLGFLQMPHLVQNQLVFCSQGDVFITTIKPENQQPIGTTTPRKALPAVKLTTTIGNVLDPRLHPNLRYLAYTATYTGRRDVYLLDLKGGKPAVRLTYWDASSGVNGLIGWWGNNALVFRAMSNEISLPDYRLYILHLGDDSMNDGNMSKRSVEEMEMGDIPSTTTSDMTRRNHTSDTLSSSSMLQIEPIPLSQARDAARHEACWYFVRYSQSSHTIRYVGGTAEQLYRYCDGDDSTDRLLFEDQYNGTSKAPQMYSDNKHLFFLSDRGRQNDDDDSRVWQPDRMNVWALPLSSDLTSHTADSLIQITDTSCDFEGRVIQEYSVDQSTGNMVLRIGADMYWMTADAIHGKLTRRQLKEGEIIKREKSFDENQTLTGDDDLDETFGSSLDVEFAENETTVYYNFQPPQLQARYTESGKHQNLGSSTELSHIPIVVHSDFHTHQERIIPLNFLNHLTSADVYETAHGSLHFITTLRGQLWVAPVEDDLGVVYGGSGRNLPERKYRVAPSASMGGVVRILAVCHVPNPVEDETSDRRLSVILATDPLTETAEHAFYLIETQAGITPLFLDMKRLPMPFLGGHVSGGSTKTGGLGSVEARSVKVSPCGRRMTWTDRDGRIVVMTLPHYQNLTDGEIPKTVVLPQENELGSPMIGEEVELTWSPGGRYLAIEHNARNQFTVISVVDLGDPFGEEKVAEIEVGRIFQATPDRFNSMSAFWGRSLQDIHEYAQNTALANLLGAEPPTDVATTLFFLSDRDINSDVNSPWGTRQPMPHFKQQSSLFALPFSPKDVKSQTTGSFGGAGVKEVTVEKILTQQQMIKSVLKASRHRRSLRESLAGSFRFADEAFANRNLAEAEEENTGYNTTYLRQASFPKDMNIDFGPSNDSLHTVARRAYRVATIPAGNYEEILSQTPDDGSFVLIEMVNGHPMLKVFLADGYPSDQYLEKEFTVTGRRLASCGMSTSSDYLFFAFSPDGQTRIVPNRGSSISMMLLDTELDENIVSHSGIHLSVWPSLEYRQLYDDAWRMLRDYYYDPDMTGIDWVAIHQRFLPLLSRCAKREELDDVLIQMASELSALHVFVYGGEKDSPTNGMQSWANANEVASLGATFRRMPEWNGYQITSIAQSDPDFTQINGNQEVYSPLCEETLRLSGQKGLQVGDVIVGVNGDSVMNVPDIHMLLRGTAGQSVRLDVIRFSSAKPDQHEGVERAVEPVIVVPIDTYDADDLRYFAWEWKTRQLVDKLANENEISVGYVHLQDMSGPGAENAFARGFFPNYHKDGFILDVRHNRGGNIDSWVLDVLQRKAWMYWQSRDFNQENGGLGWDEQFAFRGHIVVLMNEKTSSDGEGVSRGISELGIGTLIGTRTWGGGIWLASDNHLVDGGIATAPEIATYNENFSWGMGIEQMGVDPDILVDNDPRSSYSGEDRQLEAAIKELKEKIQKQPITTPMAPERKKDMTMGNRECK